MPSLRTPSSRVKAHRADVRRRHAPRRRPSGRGSAGVALAALTALALTLPGLAAPRAAAAGPALGECGAGQLCFWEGAGFQGARQVYELATTDLESCVPLPEGTRAGSFANRMGRPVTVYQSAHCDTTGEFTTHPSGSWTPEGAYAVRAFTVWER